MSINNLSKGERFIYDNEKGIAGSFSKGLAELFYKADPFNFASLRRAFPEEGEAMYNFLNTEGYWESILEKVSKKDDKNVKEDTKELENFNVFYSDSSPINIGDKVRVLKPLEGSKLFEGTLELTYGEVTGDDYNYVPVIMITSSDLWNYRNIDGKIVATNVIKILN